MASGLAKGKLLAVIGDEVCDYIFCAIWHLNLHSRVW